MGQRDAGIGGASERRGDAGHHGVIDARRAQRLQFLAAAAEHEGIAALQAHHHLAGARVLDQQAVDLRLRCTGADAPLADADLIRVAPREFQHLVADQRIVQDHVRLLQRAQRVQRQQSCRARTRADQNHAPAARSQRLRQRFSHGALGGLDLASLDQRRHAALQQRVVPVAARVHLRPRRTDARAPAVEQPGERTQRWRQQALDALTHPPRQHRRRATGGHRDHQRRAVDDRRHLEAGQRHVIDHIHPDPARRRSRRHALVQLAVVGGGHRQPDTIQLRRREHQCAMRQLSLSLECQQAIRQTRRHHLDARPSAQQQRDLALRHRSAADHQHGTALEVCKQRIQVHRRLVRECDESSVWRMDVR